MTFHRTRPAPPPTCQSSHPRLVLRAVAEEDVRRAWDALTTSKSIMGFAVSQGTDVLPTCSMETAKVPQGMVNPLPSLCFCATLSPSSPTVAEANDQSAHDEPSSIVYVAIFRHQSVYYNRLGYR